MEQSYDEWQRTTLQPECSDDDWLALGLAALAVNQPYRTMEACRKVLHNRGVWKSLRLPW